MPVVKRAYKYRFYPTDEQRDLLTRTFGSARYVYNWGLRLRQDAWYQRQERVNYHATSTALTELKKQPEYSWLNEVSSVPLQQALRHLGTAFQNFWVGRAKYPRFKKKHHRQSIEYTRSAFRWDGESLILAKMTEPLSIRWSRHFQGEPSTVTISRDPSARYFVSFLVEQEIAPLPPVELEVGIDVGITDVCVTSKGFKSGAPKYFRKYERELARRQRILSRRQKGSRNWEKGRRKVARTHAKIADCRNDFLHKLSTQVIRENQTIAVETLAVKNMLQNRNLSKSIADSGWGEFLRQLQYKADWYGRTVIGIDRWYPSSKRCFDCGWVNEALTLDDRTWTCAECGATHDRDINAAKNILAAGQAVSAFGESVSPVSNIRSSR